MGVSEGMCRDQANRLSAEIAKLERRRVDETGRLARLRQEIGRIKEQHHQGESHRLPRDYN
jgi:hypothetical protein